MDLFFNVLFHFWFFLILLFVIKTINFFKKVIFLPVPLHGCVSYSLAGVSFTGLGILWYLVPGLLFCDFLGDNFTQGC